MKLAYIILAHKNWDQLGMLARTLKEDWNDIFIHVDARSDFEQATFDRGARGVSTFFVQPRIKVFWAHVSIVHATIELLKLVAAQPDRYDRVVLLSGQDFPIVPNERIKHFFDEHPDSEFLEFGKLPLRWWPYGGWDRILVYNFPAVLGPFWNRILRVAQMSFPFRRKALANMRIYGCSQWFNLTAAAVEYILHHVETTDIVRKFNFTYCADEIFFQTILLNSPFAESCVNHSLRYMDWGEDASRPRVLVESDLALLAEQGRNKCLFARKFDSCVDDQILKLLVNARSQPALDA